VVAVAAFRVRAQAVAQAPARRVRRDDPGADGVVEGLSPKWKHGSGRWVRDVLARSKAPLMFRNELILVGRLCGEQPAHAGGVKRLGGKPVVIDLASGDARIEVASRAGHRALVTGPLTIDVT
jgi:hypothetical protein